MRVYDRSKQDEALAAIAAFGRPAAEKLGCTKTAVANFVKKLEKGAK